MIDKDRLDKVSKMLEFVDNPDDLVSNLKRGAAKAATSTRILYSKFIAKAETGQPLVGQDEITALAEKFYKTASHAIARESRYMEDSQTVISENELLLVVLEKYLELVEEDEDEE